MARSWVVILAVSLLSAACAGNVGDQQTQNGVPSAVSPDPPTTGSAKPVVAPTGADGPLGRRAAVTNGQVTVRVTKPSFSLKEEIVAVVANGLSREIRVQDLRTGCSVGVLERRVAAGQDLWKALPDCGSERRPVVLPVAPGLGRTIRIEPQSVAADGTALPAGTYRLVVQWTTGATLSGATHTSGISAPFTVR